MNNQYHFIVSVGLSSLNLHSRGCIAGFSIIALFIFGRSSLLYEFLLTRAQRTQRELEKSATEFNVSTEEDYKRHRDEDMDCSWIYQVGVLRVGNRFLIAFQRKEEGSPELLGELELEDFAVK